MEEKVELVFIPLAVAGHFVSAVETAKLILNRDENLCISLLIIKVSMDFSIQSYIESLTSTPRLQFVDVTLDEKSAADIFSNNKTFLEFIEAHKPNVLEFVQTKSFSSSGLNSNTRLAGFVLDMVCTSMMDVAREFTVPTYIFSASSAAFLALCFHFEPLRKENHVDITKYKNSDEVIQVQGFKNLYPAKYLPSMVTDQTHALNTFFDYVARFRETDGIIINTFIELEPFAVQSLSNSEKFPPIYTVGPVVNFKESGHGRNSLTETEEIIKWLDDQPNSSVVFLCSGSMGAFEPEQVKEIATALESCGYRFLWSLRKPPPKGKAETPSNYHSFEEVLPEGFLERTYEVGKVIGWAPQVAVLSHPAVGGFVSHCGWNSILESLCCGVPIAAWPQYAEQQMNGFLLVKELRLAVEIRIDYFRDVDGKETINTIVSAKDIESGIRQLMANGDENEIRKKVKEIKEISKATMKEGGSSYASLGLLIDNIRRRKFF